MPRSKKTLKLHAWVSSLFQVCSSLSWIAESRLNRAETIITVLLLCMLAAFSSAAERNLRFVKQFRIPGSPEVIVVSEGDFEPRSVGSYTVKVYGGSSKKFPTDDFITGLIRPRNGTVEDVRFEDIDGDGKPDILVVIRSAGTGSYLSADAFRYKSRLLEFIGSVSGLEKTADAVQALRHKFKPAAGDRPVPHPESPPH